MLRSPGFWLSPEPLSSGKPLRETLDRFLNRGGQIVFLGANMRPHDTRNGSGDPAGILGSEGGVVEWYAHGDQGWQPVHPRTVRTWPASCDW